MNICPKLVFALVNFYVSRWVVYYVFDIIFSEQEKTRFICVKRNCRVLVK